MNWTMKQHKDSVLRGEYAKTRTEIYHEDIKVLEEKLRWIRSLKQNHAHEVTPQKVYHHYTPDKERPSQHNF